MIVGFLVAGALAASAGTAVAAPATCEADGEIFTVKDTLTAGEDGQCLLGGVLAPVSAIVDYLDGLDRPDPTTTPTPTTTPPPTTTPTPTSTPVPASDASGSPTGPAAVPTAPAQAPRPPAAPAAPANLLSPVASAPGGLAAAVPSLGIGTLDPSLLLAPAGSPLRTLTGVDQGSPVTTTSDVQAMAFDSLPGGLGTPAVTGVLILSTFAGFALRHRVLRRVRGGADADANADADTAEVATREPVA